jgi:adenylate cyclase class 2
VSFEVEFKFPLEDAGDWHDRLLEIGATYIGQRREVDRYFNHPARDFAKTDEAFRIRTSGDQNWITYKGPKVGQVGKSRKEIELPVGSGEETQAKLVDMLKELGFRETLAVAKSRDKYGILWDGISVEFSLDHVEEVGTFLEIEAIAAPDQVDPTRERLERLAHELGLERSERRSYLELLLEAKGK